MKQLLDKHKDWVPPVPFIGPLPKGQKKRHKLALSAFPECSDSEDDVDVNAQTQTTAIASYLAKMDSHNKSSSPGYQPNKIKSKDELLDVVLGGLQKCELLHDDSSQRFSKVYLSNPKEATASLNAGDHKLYVGGASINLAFAKAISGRDSVKYINRYDKLHNALMSLSLSKASQVVAAADYPRLHEDFQRMHLKQ